MQINIEKKAGILTGVIAVLIGVIIFLMGTQNSSSGLFGMNHSAMDGENNSTNSSLIGSDAMFFEMMIPHHQQAVTMASFVAGKTTKQDILDLASQIKVAQEPEINELINWLETSGAGLGNGDHSMHMDGMLTEEQLTALENASGTEFDQLFLKDMIAHHEGAITMTQDLVANSSNPEVAALAADIIENQTAEIAYMKELLSTY